MNKTNNVRVNRARLHAALDEVGIMGEREDYFDLWVKVDFEDTTHCKVRGAYVTETRKVAIGFGHEFLAETGLPEPTEYFRQHVFNYRGMGICDVARSRNWHVKFFRDIGKPNDGVLVVA